MPDRKQLSVLDRLQPFLLLTAILLGLGTSLLIPGVARRLSPIVTSGVFLVIYFIMLGVRAKNILFAFTRWKPTILALGINFFVNPLLAWLLGYLFLRDNPDIWVGLILYLVTPCIGWYLVFTELADGDVELGVSLLAWNVVLQIVLLPVYMQLLAGTLVTIQVAEVLRSVVLFLILPLLLAGGTRWLLQRRAVTVEDFSRRMNLPVWKVATLMAVIAAMFASQGHVLMENPGVVLKMMAPGMLFFAVAFAIAIIAGRLFRLTYPETALLVFTTTARNSEVSLAIAVTAFASPLIALTVVIGPSLELPVLILLLRVLTLLRANGWFVLGGEHRT